MSSLAGKIDRSSLSNLRKFNSAVIAEFAPKKSVEIRWLPFSLRINLSSGQQRKEPLMRMSNTVKISCSLLMSILMTNAPSVAMANQMISTSAVVVDLDRAQAQDAVQNYINQPEVQNALMKSGISMEEASARVASLSETELRQLSGKVQQAQAGGDILIAILIIVLIIFLIKRI